MKLRRFTLTLILGLLVLSACGGETETPTPEAVEEYQPLVSVTGEVVPKTWATVSAQRGGMIAEIPVDVNDTVEQGELLLQLDDAEAQLNVAQAQTSLDQAEANLAQIKAEPRSEEIAQAEAALKSAEASLQKVLTGVDDQQVISARYEMENAEARMKQAQAAYDPIKWMPDIALRPESLRLQEAANAYQAAKARYQDLIEEPSAADVEQAEAQIEQAEAQLALVKAGTRDEAINVAQRQVEAAEVTLQQAQLALDRTSIEAPFAGTIGMIRVKEGEFVAPGQPLVTLGDLGTLRVETTDLDEVDVARISLDQEATVTFDAYPDRTYTGRVTRISPMAEPGQGGVNYTVIIEVEELDNDIRWGMTAFVDMEITQP
jgi:multidrug resistance efflux pump